MTLAQRLWAYQASRFPLARTVPLVAVFSAASVNVSALMAGRALPGWGAYGAAFLLGLILFWQMRVADEVKDAEDDRRYRPERPIPAGLVSLRLVVALGLVCVPVALGVAWWAGVVPLLLLVWGWLAAMTAEFGVPRWLKARPVLYLVSHMAIMPLMDLMLTGVEWRPRGGPAPELWLFLALSFVNGVVLEVGRKLWAPEAERTGVETYSRIWGPRRGATVFEAAIVLALGLLVGVGWVTGAFWPVTLAGGVGAVAAIAVAEAYAARPSPRTQGAVDAAAGLWVLLCYGTAGFLPVWLGGGA